MSAAAAATPDAAAAPAKKGKKKLIIIIAVVLAVLLGAGGGGMFYMKKKAAAEAEAAEAADGEDGDLATAHASPKSKGKAKPDLKHPPTYLPLDPFVVNLADKDADRYAQIGITLEVEDAKFADQMKAYMPALRNGVLMLLAHKTSRELLERSGKEQLAAEIQRESARTLGLDVDEPEEEADESTADAKPKGKSKAKKKAPAPNPIHHVHFSTFIIQ